MKSKKLSNVRAAGKDEAIRLTPPRPLTLEQAIAPMEDDEPVEVTPKAIGVRKRWPDPNKRNRREKQNVA
jgi:GTP-binding protein